MHTPVLVAILSLLAVSKVKESLSIPTVFRENDDSLLLMDYDSSGDGNESTSGWNDSSIATPKAIIIKTFDNPKWEAITLKRLITSNGKQLSLKRLITPNGKQLPLKRFDNLKWEAITLNRRKGEYTSSSCGFFFELALQENFSFVNSSNQNYDDGKNRNRYRIGHIVGLFLPIGILLLLAIAHRACKRRKV
ncbi:hypothetical protein CEXT_271201 [Caerostris extrusa]|uniref:Uncharacterized protein n=1 Tax=Caerostris extrusa TaxID=172846 RepID=A0AAV4Y1Y0_CAEEX|nr:hypothetical protein CEXT_271201 [Caerostris extrusa]